MYNYDRNVVLLAYRCAHPDDLDPKEKTLTDYDKNFFDTYDREIQKQATPAQIPLNVFTRSMLAFFADASTGKAVATRVKHGCKYFDGVRPQSSAVVVAVTEPAGGGE